VNNKALLECLSIFAGLLFAAFITALCDYKKEAQILLLHDEINNAEVTVYRGSFGNTIDIPVRELVVGDIVDIKQGDRVPADCLLVEEMNITVDQSLYFKDKYGTGEHFKVVKEPSDYYGPNHTDAYGVPMPDNHKTNPDPFLFSDTKIMTGTGKALVCCVGSNTLLA
jgi:Ca2+-transporting ATPase